MAPTPENNSLYDCACVESQPSTSWMVDVTPAVYETSNCFPENDSVVEKRPDPSAVMPCCVKGATKMATILKASWRNPRYFRWVMTIITSLVFVNVYGFFNSFGLLYMCLRRDLHSTAVQTGWVASLGWSIGIASPLINALYQRFGPRKLSIAGSVFCFVGLLSSSFVQSIGPMFVTFGLIFGAGVSLLLTASMNVIASHFDSGDCTLPTALPGIGGSIGMLIYSPVLELAYESFGWRTSLRFIAVLILVVGLFGAIWHKRPKPQKTIPSETVKSTTLLDTTAISPAIIISPINISPSKQEEAECNEAKNEGGKGLDEVKPLTTTVISYPNYLPSSKEEEECTEYAKEGGTDAPLSNTPVQYPDLPAYTNGDETRLEEGNEGGSKTPLVKVDKAQLARERQLKSRENYILLLKDPLHWMFCLATMLSNVVLVFNIINLVELMTSSGYSAQKSAFFMSILSFSETGFRLVAGIFGDRLPCARILTLPVVCLISACNTFALTISTSTAVIICYVCIAGLGRAVCYSIIFSASIETFGHAVHQEAFSILLVAYGVACFPSAVIPGLSFDLTGSYQPANYCGSVMWLLSAALYLAVYCIKNRQNRLQYAAMDAETSTSDVTSRLDEQHVPLANEHAQGASDALIIGGFVDNALEAVDTMHIENTTKLTVQDDRVIIDKISTV